MKEIWKDLNIEKYRNFYMVSSLGNVKSKDREVKIHRKNGKIFTRINKGKILKQGTNNRGYKKYELYDREGNVKTLLIHRLIALTFIPKVEGKNQVNHKNGIKNDNRIENLEWVNQEENMKHSYDMNIRKPPVISEEQRKRHSEIMKNKYKIAHPNAIPIIRIDPDSKEIKEYSSAAKVLEDPSFEIISRQVISKRCRDKNLKSYKGYIWKYKEI